MKGPYLSRALGRLVPGIAGLMRSGNKHHSDGEESALDFGLDPDGMTDHRLGLRPGRVPGGARRHAATGLTRMRCRWCATTIRSTATTCPVCMRPLEPERIDVFDWPPWRGKDSRVLATDIAVPLTFEYAVGVDRKRRRIVAEHAFEWAQAIYVRGHEAQRGYTRSYCLDHMENVVDERSGDALKDAEAIRRTLLRSARQQAAPAQNEPAPPCAEAPEQVIVSPPPAVSNPTIPETDAGPENASAPRADDTDRLARPSLEDTDEPFLVPPAASSRTAEADATAAPSRQSPEGGSDGIALTVPEGWVPAIPDDSIFRRREHDRPLMQAVRHKGVPFAQGFLIAGSLAVGAIGFIVAERGKTPSTPSVVAQAVPPRGYDRKTRQEMLALVHSLREATAAAQAAGMAAKEARAAANGTPRMEPVPESHRSAPLTAEEVRMLQTALDRLGYPAGTPDGIFGAKTGAALAAWQSDRRLIQDHWPLRALLAMIRAELVKSPGPTDAHTAAAQ